MTLTADSVDVAAAARLTRLTGGEALVRVLRACGISDIYGVVGGKLTAFLAALAAEPALRYVGTRHEAAGAFMAAATFQATGRVAACIGEVGPGSHNLASGMGVARGNNLPLLAITSNNTSRGIYPFQGGFMDVDAQGLFGSITKWNALVRDPRRIPELVHWALREALTGRPGPVHLEFPTDVLAASAEFSTTELDTPLERWMPAGRVHADPSQVAAAAALLARAERPLLIAGGGLVVSQAAPEFRRLADKLNAAATATQMGTGAIASNSPRFIGQGGVVGGETLMRAMREADTVLAVGCRFSSWTWAGPGPAVKGWPGQELIQVDVDPTAIGRSRAVSLGIQGDAQAVLRQLLEALDTHRAPRRPWLDSLLEQYAAQRARLVELARSSGEVMHPAALAHQLAAALPTDSLVVYDGGHTTFWSNDFTPVAEPRERFQEPGMAHLGFGVPYANALKLQFPERPVFNITGDGAFGFTLNELDTARRYGLNPIHVIHNNAAWGIIQFGQRRGGFEVGASLEGTDYAAIARGFGCFGERVSRPEEVGPMVERALASGRPAVIDAQVQFAPHPCMPLFGAIGRDSQA